MLIGLVGDLDGHALHALAVILGWQRRHSAKFDLVIQLGNMTAFPTETAARNRAFNATLDVFPHQLDFCRILDPDPPTARALSAARQELARPVHFIHGSFDDIGWLSTFRLEDQVDPFDLFRFVPNGTLLDLDGTVIGFVGGVAHPYQDAAEQIDQRVVERLLADRPKLDLLATHDAPYGISTGFYGQTQGSREVTALIDGLQPKFHASSMYHHPRPPCRIGTTTAVGLDSVVAHFRQQCAHAMFGCLAVLDTSIGNVQLVEESWLTTIAKQHFDFCHFAESGL